MHDSIHAVMWYRSERMSEQDESADMQTDELQREAEGRAHRRNDPKFHRPQQVVSFLDGLVGEVASMSTVRAHTTTHAKK